VLLRTRPPRGNVVTATVPKYFHVAAFAVMARDITCHFVPAGHVLLGALQVVIIILIHVGIVIAVDTTTSLAPNAGVGEL